MRKQLLKRRFPGMRGSETENRPLPTAACAVTAWLGSCQCFTPNCPYSPPSADRLGSATENETVIGRTLRVMHPACSFQRWAPSVQFLCSKVRGSATATRPLLGSDSPITAPEGSFHGRTPNAAERRLCSG